MQMMIRFAVLVSACALTAPAVADVVISEIMYNPASDEKPPARAEWIELYNTGDTAVDLAGWRLADEDGETEPFPADATIEPRQAVVLVPAEGGVDAFRAAWGDSVVVYPVEKWSTGGLNGLANTPGEKNGKVNERLILRQSDGSTVDEVAYDDEGVWPSDDPHGPSIYVIPNLVSTQMNDDGPSWRRSEVGLHGARAAVATEVFKADDVGSPGHVTEREE